MAISTAAIASPRNLYSGILTTTANTTVYTAPASTANVTSPSSTAYIKELIISNYIGTAAIVTIVVNGQYLMNGVTINPNDAKVLSGLNTMLNAGSVIQAWAGTGSAIALIASGVEVQ